MNDIEDFSDIDRPQINRNEIAEQAADNARAGYEFQGRKLEPWSMGRQAAAQRLGLHYYKLSQGDFTIRTAQDEETGKEIGIHVYDGLTEDIYLFLLLSTLGPVEILRIRTREDAMLKAFDLAERWNIGANTEEYWQGYNVFFQAITDDLNTRAKQKKSTVTTGNATSEEPEPLLQTR